MNSRYFVNYILKWCNYAVLSMSMGCASINFDMEIDSSEFVRAVN